MKKLFITMLLVFGITFNLTIVKADIGPKPSLKITIIGMEDMKYTLDFLSEDINGNFKIPGDDTEDVYTHYLGEEYPDELYTFVSSDGLSVWSKYGSPMPSIRLIDDTTNQQVFGENYHPPVEFRVIIYLEDGTSIISKLVSRQYFDSHMTWDVTDVDKTIDSENLGGISGNIHVGPYEEITGWEKLSGVSFSRMSVRILITMAIELLILFFFRYNRKESYLIVGVTNIITQILLTYLVARTAVYNGYFTAVLLLLFLEAFIFVLEGVIYGNLLKEKSVWRAIGYTFVANLATLITGFYLVIYL